MRALKEDVGVFVTDQDPFTAADSAKERAEAAANAQMPKLTPLDQSRDCPDTMIVEPLVWSKLQELRLSKIEKEIELRVVTLAQAEMKKMLDEAQATVDRLETDLTQFEREREDIKRAIVNADQDVEFVVRLKQGQDEVSTSNTTAMRNFSHHH